MKRDNKGRFTKGNRLQNLSGKKFGRLTAVRLSERRSGRKTCWDCLCECGNTKTIRTDSLKSGTIRSCGCLKKEQDAKNLPNGRGIVTHGLSKERIYSIWTNMISRCENPQNHSYNRYGGRGITVCEEWKDVTKFVDWAVSNGYEDNLTIERINNDGNYEPENCTWIPFERQARNKRNTVYITYDGITMSISEWSEKTGIDQHLLRNRYQNLGIRGSDLFKPERPLTNVATFLTHDGETKSIVEWANQIGIKPSTLSERYRNGMKPPKLFYKGDLRKYNKTTPR